GSDPAGGLQDGGIGGVGRGGVISLNRHSGTRHLARARNDDGYVVSTPTIAPIKHVVIVPETIDFTPSALISSRRSGAMVPSPPIMMPRLPKLAKPHIA